MKVETLLPAYNEERNIRIVIKDVKKYLPKAKILVVDDGSADRTGEIAKNENVFLIRHKKNKGKGEALKTGIKYFLGKCDAIIIIDTDRQYFAKDAPKFVYALQKADFVMGKRNFSKVPFRHMLGNWVWRTSFNILFGTKLRDTNCGFIGLSRKAMRKIRNVHGGYIIENSMLSDAVKAKLKISQVPVSVSYKYISGVPRGIRMVLGVMFFIITEGIKYRIGRLFEKS